MLDMKSKDQDQQMAEQKQELIQMRQVKLILVQQLTAQFQPLLNVQPPLHPLQVQLSRDLLPSQNAANFAA